MQEEKQRKKLRKVKKVWVVVAIIIGFTITMDVAFANHQVFAFLSNVSKNLVSTVTETFTSSPIDKEAEVNVSSSSGDLPSVLGISFLDSNPLFPEALPLIKGSDVSTCDAFDCGIPRLGVDQFGLNLTRLVRSDEVAKKESSKKKKQPEAENSPLTAKLAQPETRFDSMPMLVQQPAVVADSLAAVARRTRM